MFLFSFFGLSSNLHLFICVCVVRVCVCVCVCVCVVCVVCVCVCVCVCVVCCLPGFFHVGCLWMLIPSWLTHLTVLLLVYAAGKDAANDSVSGIDVFTPAVFWCYALHPDEWKKPTWVCPVCDKKAPYDISSLTGMQNNNRTARNYVVFTILVIYIYIYIYILICDPGHKNQS